MSLVATLPVAIWLWDGTLIVGRLCIVMGDITILVAISDVAH